MFLQRLPRVSGLRLSRTYAVLGDLLEGPAASSVSLTLPPLHLDKKVQDHLAPKVRRNTELLLPLKRRLYEANVAKYGFFKNNHPVTVDLESYTLRLEPSVVEQLEPSVYLRLFRLKGTPKKGMMFTRLLRGLSLKDAITQCHFSSKGLLRPVGELLRTAIAHAGRLNQNVDECFVDQIWVGLDGMWQKRLDIKGRGRKGIIRHRYIHVRAIIRTDQTANRRRWEKTQHTEKKKLPLVFSNHKAVRGKTPGWYKW